jgi:hypothetical protein
MIRPLAKAPKWLLLDSQEMKNGVSENERKINSRILRMSWVYLAECNAQRTRRSQKQKQFQPETRISYR